MGLKESRADQMKVPSNKLYFRRAYHAGSWYEDETHALNQTLERFLISANENIEPSQQEKIPRGIISPHAGFRYSGPTAAFGFQSLKEAFIKHNSPIIVIVLHPSHHVYLDRCAVSGATSIQTPLGDIPVNNSIREELLQTGEFAIMTKETDEKEHSGEMQYPFIQKVFLDAKESLGNDCNLSLQVLPIMVGAIETEQEQAFGKLLSAILARSDVFTVVSSDFCHWGRRFGFAPTHPPDQMNVTQSFKEIHEYIEWMDHLGMDHIASQQPGAFASYIRTYQNTICGRHNIAVYLHALQESKSNGLENVEISFVKYAQSSQVKHPEESSVSYASAVIREI